MKVKGSFCWGRSPVLAGWSGLWRSRGAILANVAGTAGSGCGSPAEDRVGVACQWRQSSETRTADRISLDARRLGMFGSLLLSVEPQRSLWDLFIRGLRVQESSTGHFLPERLRLHQECHQYASFTSALWRISTQLVGEICSFVAFVYGIHRTDLTNTESSVEWRNDLPTTYFRKYRTSIAINVNDTQE